MKPNKFLMICFSLFAGFGLTYFIVIDSYVIYKRLVPRSYRQFLLEGSADYQGKIIIVGGSDAHSGIDALEMERYFKVPVINIGVDATYPLRHKILSLKKYIQPGDIVIFSLAWHYYFESEFISLSYVKSVVDQEASTSFYFKTLSLYERAKFIFYDLPYTLALKSIISRPGLVEKTNYQIKALSIFTKRIVSDKGDARGSAVSNSSKRINPVYKSLTCDQFLFFEHIIGGIEDRGREEELNERFFNGDANYLTTALENTTVEGKVVDLTDARPTKTLLDNLQLIELIKKAGAKVYFAWPIVVDSEESKCYESKYSKGIDRFIKRIEKLLIEHEFDSLGDYDDSIFLKKCFLDSYFHIKYECAGKRTKSLIASLIEKGEKPSNNGYTKHDFDTKLNSHVR